MTRLKFPIFLAVVVFLVGCSSVPRSDMSVQSSDSSNLWERNVTVHRDLPEFTVRLVGEGDRFTELEIINTDTGTVVYEDSFLVEPNQIYKGIFELQMVDVDFDGYKDIEIFGCYNGTWRKGYTYIIWDAGAGAFVRDSYGLEGLGLPGFDAENQLVYSFSRSSALDHWYYTHRYIDGVLTVVKAVAENGVWDNKLDQQAREQIKAMEPLYEEGTVFMRVTTRELDDATMELVQVEEKYILINVDGATLGEYTADSQLGVLLAEYMQD